MLPGNKATQIPLNIAGSNKYGRYKKISSESTYNMFLSSDWLVSFPGYKKVKSITEDSQARGVYVSARNNSVIAVIENGVYEIGSNIAVSLIATIDTFSGDVSIAENSNSEIAICDKLNIYIYNYSNNNFQKASLDFTPVYVTSHNTYFLAVDLNGKEWHLSNPNDGLTWDAFSAAPFQTQADKLQAIVPIPGKSNTIFLIGNNSIEVWTDVGAKIFPYEKNQSFNIGFGCVNEATIAVSDTFMVWLAINQESGPVLMMSTGGNPRPLGNPQDLEQIEGINFQLSQLSKFNNSYGFLFKIDGHLMYIITFPDDNLSLMYDFKEQQFFNLTDEKMDFFIAKKVFYFNDSYYFLSFKDGDVYQMGSEFIDYDGKEIPRIRILSPFRMPDTSRFIVRQLEFPVEQGESDALQNIDFSMSKNGGASYTNAYRYTLNNLGKRKNKFNVRNLGSANELVLQFRFWGFSRFVATNGIMEVYK